MKYTFIAIVAVGLAAYASAECANACSGHGTCANNDECNCFPNWMANDCSERVCPYGLAFVDSPNGDLNHDGSVTAATTSPVTTQRSNVAEYENAISLADNDNSAHFYSECSSKGVCDRESGTCQCFAGYTGSSCQRTACPNDCSGHGVCRTVQEIAAGGLNYKVTDNVAGTVFWTGVNPATPVTYRLWDADKAQSCVCDEGYSGPDCTRRECPRGDDPLTHRNRDCGGDPDCLKETQTVTIVGQDHWVAWGYIQFKDWTGETWRTDYLELGTNLESGCVVDDGNFGPVAAADFKTLLEAKIKAALQAIPNGALEDVGVTVTRTPEDTLKIDVVFNSNPGNQNELEFVFNAQTETYADHPHCVSVASLGTPAIVTGVLGAPIVLDAQVGAVGDRVGARAVTPAQDVVGLGSKPVIITSITAGTGEDQLDFPLTSADMVGVSINLYPEAGTLASGAAATVLTSISPVTSSGGTGEESTCSNRGLCDYETGLCRCFRGYYEDDCSRQSALAGAFTAAV